MATDTENNSQNQQTPDPVPNGHWLNAPNSVTIARLGLAIVLFWMIRFEGLWISAAVVFIVAALTDALDGYLARKYGQVTVLGRILDPFVDKFIICGAFVFLLEKRLDSGVNSWIVIIVLGREMFVSSLRGILEKEGRDFSANMAGKLKMVLQCAAVTGCLLSLSPDIKSEAFNQARDIVLWLAVAATVWSGLVYVVRAYKLFTKND
ncbi:MAG: CDP-diacylglycerol--glycerol-3-phosphate 3-phosphatidyltransferase [Planctomycetaceae bacterium]